MSTVSFPYQSLSGYTRLICICIKYIKHMAFCLASLLVSIAIVLLANTQPAQSSSEIAEQYHILTSSWRLNESAKDGEQLTIEQNGKDYVWKVDLALLANRLDPTNLAGADSTYALTHDYLSKLGQLPPQSEIIIELVNNQKGAPLVVAGIGLYDSDQQWQHATKFGSRTLNLSAEKVKELGSAEKYHKKVLQFCDQEWTKIKARRDS